MGITIDGAGTITGLDADGISAQPVFPGQVLQVVSTTKTDAFSASLTSNARANVTGLDVSITPTSTSSKILIFVAVTGHNGSESGCAFTVQRNSTDILVPSAGTGEQVTGIGFGLSSDSAPMSNSVNGFDEPNTTSSVTYSVTVLNFSVLTRTIYVNTSPSPRARGISTITAMEIAG